MNVGFSDGFDWLGFLIHVDGQTLGGLAAYGNDVVVPDSLATRMKVTGNAVDCMNLGEGALPQTLPRGIALQNGDSLLLGLPLPPALEVDPAQFDLRIPQPIFPPFRDLTDLSTTLDANGRVVRFRLRIPSFQCLSEIPALEAWLGNHDPDRGFVWTDAWTTIGITPCDSSGSLTFSALEFP